MIKDSKKVFIIALLLFLTFSLGAVAAQEDGNSYQSNFEEDSIETPIESVGEENKLSASDKSISKADTNLTTALLNIFLP